MFWRNMLLLGAAIIPSTCLATASNNLEVSIYNNNLALVKDSRNLSLAQGKNNIAFEGVATGIKPESVIIVGKGINVLEQNYNYDLITSENILQKSVGNKVKTVLLNPETGKNIFDEAKIVSVNYGNPVLEFDYGIEANFPGRVVFDKLPSGLNSKPTLEAKVYSTSAGMQELSLAYLTNGMSWKTNYVAKIGANNQLDLTGWVTINNQSGIDYHNAKVSLIAGDVNEVSVSRAVYMSNRIQPKMALLEASMDSAVAGGAPQQISGYQLYALPESTDIKDNQTKQISLIEKNNVKFKKEGRLNSSLYIGGVNSSEFEKEHPALYYTMNNVNEDNLGLPLPAGIIRFYENDNSESLQFIGENSINHVAEGEKIDLRLGSMFNVFVDGKIAKVTKVAENRISLQNSCEKYKISRNYDVIVTFNNGGKNEEEVLFTQNINQNTKILAANIEGKTKNINQYEWRIKIPANGKTVLTFTANSTSEERRCD